MKGDAEITKLLQRRQARRRRLAQLSFEEKIEIVERLRGLQFNRSLLSARRAESAAAAIEDRDKKDSTPSVVK